MDAPFVTIERAQERGELPRTQDACELVASIPAPILYGRFSGRAAGRSAR